jgi:hypothetical protein
MRVGIATDHGGFGLREELLAQLRSVGHEVVDFGAHALNPGDDYPDFVIPLARAVAAGQVERGVAICGSGVGASVCANKIAGARAGRTGARSFLRPARRRGRPYEHHLYGGPDSRAVRRMGPRRGVLGGRVQPRGSPPAPFGQGGSSGGGKDRQCSGIWTPCPRVKSLGEMVPLTICLKEFRRLARSR